MNRFGSVCACCEGSGEVKCPTCKGVGSVWILPADYSEWEPESWTREDCPRCHANRMLACTECRDTARRFGAKAA